MLVGPPGVFLLETKNLTGVASLEHGKLVIRRGSDDRDSWTPARPIGTVVKRAAFDLRADLLDRTGVRWVQGMVVLWSDFPDGEANQDGIVYIHGSKLRQRLETQRTELTPEDVRRVDDYLTHLEARGFKPVRRPGTAVA